MDKCEEAIIKEMVAEFHDSFGYDPTGWVKVPNCYGVGIDCLMACGRTGEGVVREIADGFNWMKSSTQYTPNEMALLASGWFSSDEESDLHIFGRIFEQVGI